LERSLGAGAQPSSAAGASAETTHSPAIPPVPSREEVEVAVRIESTGEAERAGEPPDAASQESRFDAATGLPGPEAATEAILAVGPKGRPNCYIAAFYVKRMDAVNARFGGTLRDEALRFCAQQIAGLTGPSEVSLFRWKGMGGFLGLLIRQGSLIDVQQEISRAFSSKLTFQSKNGSVLLPLSISTHVMHAAAHNCAGLIEGIDEFFALAMMQG
jgi:GGDEF domain-containing protein